jgi:cytochrome b6-f complex iron-sulfur subunit
MNAKRFSRRDFQKLGRNALLTASGLLGLGGLMRFLGYPSQPSVPTEFDLGLASDYPIGSRTVRADIPAVLIRDDKGFFALSLVCTHLGCTVESQTEGFVCHCHGSRFDADGKVTRRPAIQALSVFRLESKPDDKMHLYTI